MKRFSFGPTIMLVAIALGFTNLESCKDANSPSPSEVADDVKVDLTAGCTTVTAIVQNATEELVCATAEELAQLADLITHQIGSNVVMADAAAPKCVTLNNQSICATPARMASAIRTIKSRRDGGK